MNPLRLGSLRTIGNLRSNKNVVGEDWRRQVHILQNTASIILYPDLDYEHRSVPKMDVKNLPSLADGRKNYSTRLTEEVKDGNMVDKE